MRLNDVPVRYIMSWNKNLSVHSEPLSLLIENICRTQQDTVGLKSHRYPQTGESCQLVHCEHLWKVEGSRRTWTEPNPGTGTMCIAQTERRQPRESNPWPTFCATINCFMNICMSIFVCEKHCSVVLLCTCVAVLNSFPTPACVHLQATLQGRHP